MTMTQLDRAKSLGWICDRSELIAHAVLSALLFLEIYEAMQA